MDETSGENQGSEIPEDLRILTDENSKRLAQIALETRGRLQVDLVRFRMAKIVEALFPVAEDRVEFERWFQRELAEHCEYLESQVAKAKLAIGNGTGKVEPRARNPRGKKRG